MSTYLSDSHIPLSSFPQRALCAAWARPEYLIFHHIKHQIHHILHTYTFLQVFLTSMIGLLPSPTAHTLCGSSTSQTRHMSYRNIVSHTKYTIHHLYTCLHIYLTPTFPFSPTHSAHSVRLEHVSSGAFALVTTALRVNHTYTCLQNYLTPIFPFSVPSAHTLCGSSTSRPEPSR